MPLGGGRAVDAQHGGYVRTVDIGIQQTDAGAALGQRHGDVDRHRGFADAALARADRDRVADRHVHQPAHAAVIGHIGVPLDRNGFHARDGHDGLSCFLLDLAAQRAGRRGQHDCERDLAVRDLQVPDHVQGDQVPVEFRLLDLAQGGKYCRLVQEILSW